MRRPFLISETSPMCGNRPHYSYNGLLLRISGAGALVEIFCMGELHRCTFAVSPGGGPCPFVSYVLNEYSERVDIIPWAYYTPM